MKLLLDLGNSALKWAVRDSHGIGPLHSQALSGDAPLDWRQLPQPTAIGLSSVASDAQTRSVIEWCQNHWNCPVQRLRAQASAAGVSNAYRRPQDLGSDRWMALIAAHRLWPGAHCIVDAGSALTIDLLSADGQHKGGYITPGYRAMSSALHAKTRLTPPDTAAARGHRTSTGTSTGTSTNGCIRAGINGALIGLIQRVHDEFEHGNSQLIITGGDALRLLPQLPNATRHVPELVLTGIDTLLRADRSTLQPPASESASTHQTDPTP